MLPVTLVGGLRTAAPRPASRAGTGFRLPGTGPAEPAREAAAPQALFALDLQAEVVPKPPVADSQIAERAEQGMADLRGLQLALLGGGAPDRARLAELAALPDAADPALSAIVCAIRVRARVEMARAAAHPVSRS